MAQTILIVEDEPRLADILEDYLRRDGYRTERTGNGLRALELWRASRPDLILLDVMLPELDGFEIARRVRAEGDTPIIMLTARDDEIDKLLGLGLGADDYVAKPYSPREVMARVKAVLRRAEGRLVPPERFCVGRVVVDLAGYRASCDGKELDLTVSELKLLAALARDPGRVRTRPELLAVVGDPDRFADERAVDAHIKNLRRKLGSCGDHIATVRGVGYRLEAS